MHYSHRFEAVAPEYSFRSGEHAHVRFDAAATSAAGEEIVLEIKDISPLGLIAACTRLPETGERMTIHLPGLAPLAARVSFTAGHWAGYHFEEELDWDLIAQAILAADAAASRTASF